MLEWKEWPRVVDPKCRRANYHRYTWVRIYGIQLPGMGRGKVVPLTRIAIGRVRYRCSMRLARGHRKWIPLLLRPGSPPVVGALRDGPVRVPGCAIDGVDLGCDGFDYGYRLVGPKCGPDNVAPILARRWTLAEVLDAKLGWE